MSTAGLQVVLLLVFGSPSRSLYASLLCGFYACSRELVPLILGSSREFVLIFVQGSLFPLFYVQQACLAFDLVKGLCSFFLVLLDSSAFLIYNILTFDQKKKKKGGTAQNKWWRGH